MTGFTLADIPDQTGRTAIVTGANTGIGYAIAKALAQRGARVLLACRDRARAEAAQARIAHEIGGSDTAFLPLDLADPASIRAAAGIAKTEPSIDLLIDNAGIMLVPFGHAFGVERQLGVNHFGHFALTALLIEALAARPAARVVVQASLAHRGATIDFADLDAARGYSARDFYARSKLANLLFAFEFDRRLRAAGMGVKAVACHPGIAATEIVRHLGWGGTVWNAVAGSVLNTAAMGALPALQAATDPDVQGGDYCGPYGLFEMRGAASGRAVPSAAAQDRATARRLWAVSEQVTGIPFPVPPR